MIKRKNIIKVNFKGGIVYVDQLRLIIDIIKNYKRIKIYLGNRQNLYLIPSNKYVDELLFSLSQNNIKYFTDVENYPNIVSSYVAIDLKGTTSWINESILNDVLDTFDYQPKLKINIIDINQNLALPFNCDLCFVASSYHNFWYFLIKNPLQNKFYFWNKLIYSTDLGALAKEVEDYIIDKHDYDIENIQKYVNEKFKYIFIEKHEELKFQKVSNNYNRINPNGDNSWIELCNFDSENSINFFESIVEECIKRKINKIYFTTWRTIIIKNIREEDLIDWKIVLGKNGFNIEHLSSEIYWKYEDFDTSAEKLKSYLIKELYKNGVKNSGIIYGIYTNDNFNFTANISIKIKYPFPFLPFFKYYDIYYSENLNSGKENLVFISREYLKNNLINTIKYLSKKYYEDLEKFYHNNNQTNHNSKKIKHYWVPGKIYVCKDCNTVYDPEVGDIYNNIKPGTSFDDLPDDYSCYICSAPKENFEIRLKTLEKFEE